MCSGFQLGVMINCVWFVGVLFLLGCDRAMTILMGWNVACGSFFFVFDDVLYLLLIIVNAKPLDFHLNVCIMIFYTGKLGVNYPFSLIGLHSKLQFRNPSNSHNTTDCICIPHQTHPITH